MNILSYLRQLIPECTSYDYKHPRDENKLFASDAQTLIPYRMDIRRLHRRL